MLNEMGKSQVQHSLKLSCGNGKSLSQQLQFLDASHNQRVYAEAFVQESFYKAYRARLHSFYPILLATSDQQGEFSAVAGIRPAGGEKLYSEFYLDSPVEQLLGADRSSIVEFGNLATANAGQARWLIIAMSSFIYGAGFTHVVFTVVPALYNAFRRMGLPLTKLADANRACLPASESTEWGDYYKSRPAVYSGDLIAGRAALQSIAEHNENFHNLSRLAFHAGQKFATSNGALLA